MSFMGGGKGKLELTVKYGLILSRALEAIRTSPKPSQKSPYLHSHTCILALGLGSTPLVGSQLQEDQTAREECKLETSSSWAAASCSSWRRVHLVATSPRHVTLLRSLLKVAEEVKEGGRDGKRRRKKVPSRAGGGGAGGSCLPRSLGCCCCRGWQLLLPESAHPTCPTR